MNTQEKKASPLVSVLMTAFNREKYIGGAIESVLSSTYQNWELIVVDDCSKDRTVEIAKTYQAKDSRIKVYMNDKNLGDYPNRNQAVSYAKGKYLKYVDADDMVYPYGLEIIVNNMELFPEAGWGLMSLPTNTVKQYPFLLRPIEAYRYNYFQNQIFHKAPLSSIIRRDVFIKEGGFKKIRHYGDFDFWHRLAKKHALVLMQHGLVWWRGHQDQENKKRKNNYQIGIDTINCAISHIKSKDCPLEDEEKKQILRKLRNNIWLKSYRIAKRGHLYNSMKYFLASFK